MYGFALAATTKPHSLGASNNTSYSLTVLETGSLRLRYGQGWFLLKPSGKL